jgi:hypothetical protein
MFQEVERANRRVAFVSAYRLAKADPKNKYVKEAIAANPKQYAELLGKGWTPENAGAFLLGRHAVDRTMFEYSAMARPEALQGRKGALFVFWMFKQNYWWFLKNDPGRLKAWTILLFTAGVVGLPFAEDLADLAKMLARLQGKNFDPELELRKLVASWTDERSADVALHGFGRESFGIPWAAEAMGIPGAEAIPKVDVSRRLGMGQMVPGMEAITQGISGQLKPMEAVGQFVVQASGAGFGIPFNMFKALQSNDPNTFKVYEKLLPAAARNLARAYRYAEEGESVRSGATITEFDLTDSMARAEIAAQALGFAPTRVTREWDKRTAMQDVVKFWATQRSMLFDTFGEAMRTKDREAIADAQAAIRKFNESVPDRRLRITGEALRKSRKARAAKRRADEEGTVGGKMYKGVAEGIEKAFP